MATTYKTFLNNDTVTSKTLLHEAIPLTGGIASGTYADTNIKNYSHGAFQSVYDYPYLSSSANHVFDLSVGYVTGALSSSANIQKDKKVNMYYQMAQVLMGYDVNGNIRKFDADGDLSSGTKHDDILVFNFSRLLTKDEIQKGTLSMTFLTGGTYNGNDIGSHWLELRDTNAQNNYFVNSPAGEYGVIKAHNSGANGHTDSGFGIGGNCGLVFYQAGIVILTASVFSNFGGVYDLSKGNVANVLTGSSISGACDNIRSRIHNISFNNSTELNSTIYFCRANHNEFNYSGNPTYLSSSQIVVKNNSEDTPVSYITTVGLYSSDNEMLAVAKLSEPIRKDPTTELTFRVRLDY